MKQAIEVIFEFIRSANRYFDEQQPWITINSEIKARSDREHHLKICFTTFRMK